MLLTQNGVRVLGIVDAGICFVWGIDSGVAGICCAVSNHGSVGDVGMVIDDDDHGFESGDPLIVISMMRNSTSSMNLNSRNLIFGDGGEN